MAFILQERVKLINFRSERSIHVVLAFWLFFVISSVSMTSTLIFSEWGRVSRRTVYSILAGLDRLLLPHKHEQGIDFPTSNDFL